MQCALQLTRPAHAPQADFRLNPQTSAERVFPPSGLVLKLGLIQNGKWNMRLYFILIAQVNRRARKSQSQLPRLSIGAVLNGDPVAHKNNQCNLPHFGALIDHVREITKVMARQALLWAIKYWIAFVVCGLEIALSISSNAVPFLLFCTPNFDLCCCFFLTYSPNPEPG